MKEPIHPIQAMVDGWSKAWQKERSKTQLTLGGLIALLRVLEPERKVAGLGNLDSYRGYYSDLAFEPCGGQTTVAALLQECLDAMGKEFTGYKGGEYLMGESTPLWVSEYGTASGERLMDLDASGDVVKPVTAQQQD